MSVASMRCGIVLHPAGHTRSPAMHTAAYAALGLDADYRAFDVPPDDLAGQLARLREEGVRQLAVSIPHKESIMAFVDELEPVGRAIGAVNTVTLSGDRWVGTNTDWIGALRALERAGPVDGRRAVVLGAGGTARALVYGLRERGCEVHVLNRTVERARTLVDELGADDAGPLDRFPDLAPELVINTTSVGLNEDRSPIEAGWLSADTTVLDAVYAPEHTRLLADARAAGARPVGGKWMLVHQAVEQLRRWTGLLDDPPSEDDYARMPDVMARAFDEAGQG
ncbi:MAG: shikimate dehydrogenase [Myxococcota bacterium]